MTCQWSLKGEQRVTVILVYITGSTWYKGLYQHTIYAMDIYPSVSSISRLALINNQQTTWHEKYWPFLGEYRTIPTDMGIEYTEHL